jgi:hypothetical protein
MVAFQTATLRGSGPEGKVKDGREGMSIAGTAIVSMS